jgi:hypothetical protein
LPEVLHDTPWQSDAPSDTKHRVGQTLASRKLSRETTSRSQRFSPIGRILSRWPFDCCDSSAGRTILVAYRIQPAVTPPRPHDRAGDRIRGEANPRERFDQGRVLATYTLSARCHQNTWHDKNLLRILAGALKSGDVLWYAERSGIVGSNADHT